MNRSRRSIRIEMYGYDRCPYCLNAKHLMNERGWNYMYYNIDKDNSRARELEQRLEKFGKKFNTVPQIFINGNSIGGYDKLVEFAAEVDSGRMSW